MRVDDDGGARLLAGTWGEPPKPHPSAGPHGGTQPTGPTRHPDTTAAEDGWARYICHYELTSTEAVERYAASDAAKRLRADSDLKFGYVTRHRRQVFSEVARFEVDTEAE